MAVVTWTTAWGAYLGTEPPCRSSFEDREIAVRIAQEATQKSIYDLQKSIDDLRRAQYELEARLAGSRTPTFKWKWWR